jgi:hypothetical protein
MLSEFRGKNTDKVRAIYLVTGVRPSKEQDDTPAREVALVPEDRLPSKSSHDIMLSKGIGALGVIGSVVG